MTLCRNWEFIFRSSNSGKPATDLPDDMLKRMRAASAGYCVRETPRDDKRSHSRADEARAKLRHKSVYVCVMLHILAATITLA